MRHYGTAWARLLHGDWHQERLEREQVEAQIYELTGFRGDWRPERFEPLLTPDIRCPPDV
ncbi:MAG: hypothetical protein ACREH6_13755 [Geminicoccaceae bacterium]